MNGDFGAPVLGLKQYPRGMSEELKANFRERIANGAKYYLKDFSFIPVDRIAASPGGVARAPIDFTYEVAYINRRVAARLRGEEVPPFKMEGWITAPEEFLDVAKMAIEFQAAVDDVLESLDKFPAEDLEKEIDIQTGKTTAKSMLNMVATHITYHDAQLNYIQSLYGDDEVHWD